MMKATALARMAEAYWKHIGKERYLEGQIDELNDRAGKITLLIRERTDELKALRKKAPSETDTILEVLEKEGR